MNRSSTFDLDDKSASGGARRKRVVVFESPDVVATVGRLGMLEDRVPTHDIVREFPLRSDVLAQILDSAKPPDNAPVALTGPMTTLAADADTALVVFSLRTELVPSAPVFRHVESGWLCQVQSSVSGEVKEWLDLECELTEQLSVEAAARSIGAILKHLRTEERAVVVYNVSTFDPEDQTHRFTPGSSDPYAVRANRLVGEFEALASEFGVSVVDVDGAIAELGALAHVPRAGDFSGEAATFISEDVGLLIDQSRVLGASIQAPVMRVEVPAYDRRTTHGTLAAWHVEPGQMVKQGDLLFDVRFDGLVYRVQSQEESERRAARRAKVRRTHLTGTIVLEVLAGSEGHVAALAIPEGSRVTVGDTAAVITIEADSLVEYDSSTPTFRLGMKAKTQ